MLLEEKFRRVVEYFSINMPIAETELNYASPYELLVAVILSAQCTDKRVNIIAPKFFISFPSPEILASAELESVFEIIRSCSYPNNKAKNLIGMAKVLVADFNSIVPDDIEQLQKMPGVGRKTANVIASVIFDKPALAVDTHVFRVAARLGLSINSKTPLDTEKQLVKHIPSELIPKAHHWLILHGRYVCLARKPKCENCGLTNICTYYIENKEGK
jgi:endonuclease-3